METAAEETQIDMNRSLYHHTKRVPPRPHATITDLYITRRSAPQAYTKRARTLLNDQGHDAVTLHALGAAIPTAVRLALFLVKEYHGILDVSVTTSSVPLVDDYEPCVDRISPQSRLRINSAIHLRLFKRVSDGPTTSG